jgi:AraC-like DNA-binding protein
MFAKDRRTMTGRLCLWPDGIVFVGASVRTSRPRPSTASLYFARTGRLGLRVGDATEWVRTRGVLVAPNLPQQVVSIDGEIVALKIDVESDAYRRIAGRCRSGPVYELPERTVDELSARSWPWLKGKAFSPSRLWNLAMDLVGDGPIASAPLDPRVTLVCTHLKESFKTAPSVAQLAERVGLSEGRLTHLFTQQLGVPLRRYVSWLRLRHVVYVYMLTGSLTSAAYEAGFADSAHLSRTFRSEFGLRPSALLRDQCGVKLVIGLPTRALDGPHAVHDAPMWAAAIAGLTVDGTPPVDPVGEPRWVTVGLQPEVEQT